MLEELKEGDFFVIGYTLTSRATSTDPSTSSIYIERTVNVISAADTIPPVLNNINIRSSNNNGMAKDGDTVTLTFESDKDLSDNPVVTFVTLI